MPEYELRLRFTAADSSQASRLAAAWADTCAAEYGTVYAGVELVRDPPLCRCERSSRPHPHKHDCPPLPTDIEPNTSTYACAWCGRAVALGTAPRIAGSEWFCSDECDDACTDQTPSPTGTYPLLPKEGA